MMDPTRRLEFVTNILVACIIALLVGVSLYGASFIKSAHSADLPVRNAVSSDFAKQEFKVAPAKKPKARNARKSLRGR
jgi:septal ring-binding cell division protein DamX